MTDLPEYVTINLANWDERCWAAGIYCASGHYLAAS